MKGSLFNRGFLSLIVTQFFGAANDNILKGVLVYMVIDGAWTGKLGEGGQGIVSVCFTVPFILLSGYAGQFADRNSKRFVSVLVKVVEIPIAVLALTGFWTGSLWITLAALVALTCQSAYFGPAKYGMIPELVKPQALSRANGTINMMTNLAVISGTLAAGKIADIYCPLPGADGTETGGILWLPGAALLTVAAAGLAAILFMPQLQPGDRHLPYRFNPFATYITSLKEIADKPLFIVLLAWGYFYFLAGLALLMIPEYTIVLTSYDVSRAEVSVLLGVMGIAIGVGSAAAGLISGDTIRPFLIPVGAVGLIVFFTLLGTVPPELPDLEPMWRICASSISLFIFGAGVSAGFYIIPLQALLQRLAPDNARGRLLGTANGVSFAFLTLSSILYWIIRPLFTTAGGEKHPEKIFLLCAALMAAGATFFIWCMKRRGLSFKNVD